MKRSAFLSAIFPFWMLEPDESPLISFPAQFTKDGITKRYHKQSYWTERAKSLDRQERGWLFCVSTVTNKGKAKRRTQDVRNAFVVPCDDVKSKCEVPPVEPSYILETSPDNYQYGFLIDPFDVSTPEGAAYYDGVLLGLAEKNYNDAGCRSATRVIKLPGSIHHTGFVTKLVSWHPKRVWGMDDLVEAMGIHVVDVPQRVYIPEQGGIDIEDTTDMTYRWLVEAGLTYGMTSAGFVSIKCPWFEGHTNPEDFLAGYSPDGVGGVGRGFKCFHAHCSHRRTIDLIQWVFSQGGQGLPE